MTDEEIEALIAENAALRAQLGDGEPAEGPTVIESPDEGEIAAAGDASVAVIEAQAAADVKREHAFAETQVAVIEAQAKAEAVAAGAQLDDNGDIVTDALAPESTHPYFRKWGRK